ncbi:unnamed protein product [Mycena citricolor]|uniref:Uncharacterized protein n=1 Tax=Mycena citricolor TaxID=2018698 RepID=A0AAD2H520_9AGAR|nr:unnamed protein product [Mycena citricolor]
MSTTLAISHSLSQLSLGAPPTPGSVSSASSSKSLNQEDEGKFAADPRAHLANTLCRPPVQKTSPKEKSGDEEDLRLLAISTHITELSYNISDIQTRIFEIQELRHKSQSAGDSAGTTTIIDQSLMSLDERIETVSKGMKSISDSLEPHLQNASTPTVAQRSGDSSEQAVILRKHAALVAEWEAVQDESEVLREELKEDKWLTVFRTVTDQADGMMSSLEKAVNRCQEFIWQVHKRVEDPLTFSTSPDSRDKLPSFETYTSLLESFEAKKKHYMPATSKVLSIIDKGVRDRVTKNGETLRRHAESAQRWKNLKERITRTDAEMEAACRLLVGGDTPSESGSVASGNASHTRNGYLNTPPSGSKRGGTSISGSISPLRKFARKITGATPPLTINKNSLTRTISQDGPLAGSQSNRRQQRVSIFSGFRTGATPTPMTPDRPGHKYSTSLTPDSSPNAVKEASRSRTSIAPGRQPWNSSTKVDVSSQVTVKATPQKRPPSASGAYGDMSSSLSGVFRRSLSRTSMASSRPWSPVTSSASTTHSSSRPHPPIPNYRPPSRSQTPHRPTTPSRSYTPAVPMTPRARAKTPSHIPAPSLKLRSVVPPASDDGWDDPQATTPNGSTIHPPRPPSRSMIPIPTLHLSSVSRPGTSMSYNDDSFRTAAARAQTPEFTLRARVQQIPVFPGTPARTPGRPPMPGSASKVPPSSFRDGSASRTPSRTGSRAGAYTPSNDGLPLHEYIPGNPNDPLDAEVSFVANSIAHGLLVERVDPPLRKLPREGEEVKAQYAFSNALSRKVITCKLTTLTRTGKASEAIVTRKVMCRAAQRCLRDSETDMSDSAHHPFPVIIRRKSGSYGSIPAQLFPSPKPLKTLGKAIKGAVRKVSHARLRRTSSSSSESHAETRAVNPVAPVVHLHPLQVLDEYEPPLVFTPGSARSYDSYDSRASTSSSPPSLVTSDDSSVEDMSLEAHGEPSAGLYGEESGSSSLASPPTAFVEPEVPDPFLIDDDDEDESGDEGDEGGRVALTPTESQATIAIALTQEASVLPPSAPVPLASPNLNKAMPPPPPPESDSDEEDAPEIYLPGLCIPTMFLPIPNTDPLTTLLNKYIHPPDKRPVRDLSGEWQRTDFHKLVMSNSWRALARMARDRIVTSDPEDLTLILGLWYLRLSSLARLRLFNQTTAECTNLFNLLNSIEPAASRTWLFERILPFELEVLYARLRYWAGDHMGHLDALWALVKTCKARARKAKMRQGTEVAMWKERGARVCLIIASQLVEMKDFLAAARLLEPLCTQPDGITSPAMHSAVGRIYLQAGHLGLADRHFKLAAESDQVSPSSMTRMNDALYSAAEGDWEHASQLLQAAVDEQGEDYVAVNNLCVTLLAQGKLKEGIAVMESALNTSPSSVVIAEPFLFNLSTLYELRSATAIENKRNLLIQVARFSGDGLKTACLKMPST